MSNMQAEESCAKGIQAMANGHVYLALVCFERAAHQKNCPLYNSYLAYCMAKARGKWEEAIALCRDAMTKDPGNSVHYLHLGRIYLLAGQKAKGLQTLRQGLPLDNNDALIDELERYGIRRPPV